MSEQSKPQVIAIANLMEPMEEGNIRLEPLTENHRETRRFRPRGGHGLQLGQGRGPVNLRFPLSQQVEIRPVQNIDRLRHRSARPVHPAKEAAL